MGTTIAGNQHIGTNYLKNQYIWAPGLGGKTADVELYEEDIIQGVSGEVDAATALANFKAYAKKN